MRTTFKDEALHRQMIERGFCSAPLLDAGEVESLRADMSRIRPALDFGSPEFTSILYHASFLDPDEAYRRSAYTIVRDALEPKLRELLPDYRPVTGGLLVKAAGTGQVNLHCDWTSTSDLSDVNIAVWCPLVDVEDGNGALRVIPGSHKLFNNIVAARLGGYWTEWEEELKALSEPVPLKAGEALFFDVSLLHWSRANSSNALRPVANLLYIHRQAQPVLYVVNDTFDRLKVYDMEGDALLAHSASDLFKGNVQAPSLGTIPNPNRKVTLDEVKRRLARRQGAPEARGWAPQLRQRLARLIGA
ncbi:MAG TPA: phytanoyl-CoA dioxygenase family protein [Allosphingosinicella sp.]